MFKICVKLSTKNYEEMNHYKFFFFQKYVLKYVTTKPDAKYAIKVEKQIFENYLIE